jgi:transposase-like protein
MPRKSDVDWMAVQNDRSDGKLTVAEIAKKFGTSEASVYGHTKGNGRKPAGGGTAKPARKAGASTIASAIADLRARRDRLTQAIETLEQLEG